MAFRAVIGRGREVGKFSIEQEEEEEEEPISIDAIAFHRTFVDLKRYNSFDSPLARHSCRATQFSLRTKITQHTHTLAHTRTHMSMSDNSLHEIPSQLIRI